MGARRLSAWIGAGLLSGGLLAPGSAGAESDEERAAARVAAQRGILAVMEGRYGEGVSLLERAESLVHAPTHLLYLARAWEKQGKLVRARETYLKLVGEELAPGAPRAFRDAKAAAMKEVSALDARISHVTIRLSAPNTPGVSVHEDDTRIPLALLGIPRPVDPGAHTYRAEAPGAEPATMTVIVTEGDRETVVLPIESSESLAPDPVEARPPARESAAGAGAGVRRFGYVALGASTVGIAAGTYFLVQAGKEQSNADERFTACNTRVCREEEVAAIRQVDSSAAKQRTGAVIGFAAGGAVLAAGVALLVLAEDEDDDEAPAVGLRPFVTPAGAGVFGRF